ncbi:MAG: hypothetical protein U5J95_00255 [Balneolaceae bacterium]|nr:hypothetical protein [Balneolaceae bacterium]
MKIKATLIYLTSILLAAMLVVSCGDNNNPVDNGDDDGNGNGNGTDPTSTVFDTVTVGDRQQIIVTDRGEGIGTMTLDPQFEWVLDNFVYVNEGDELTIPAGTLIKGESGQGENASALIVARGGKIQANGTAEDPIIFTSVADNISIGELTSPNLNPTTRGLWGGVIILGNARTNTAETKVVEGLPVEEERAQYGGDDDSDNSGTFRYVSIRHAGTDIGAGNEINSLTMGGVGSGTTIEYVESIANVDDGFEWFGGTVNSKYLLSVENNDDGIDWDEGFRGTNQFVLIYSTGGRGGEQDGGTDPEDGQPYANPINYNVTSIGGPDQTMTYRDNSGGQYYNSIFYNYPNGVDIEDLSSGEDSRARLENGEIIMTHNIFWNVANNDPASIYITSGDNAGIDLSSSNNLEADIVDPIFDSSYRPDDTVPAVTDTKTPGNSAIENVGYRGALNPNAEPWYVGWTLTNAAGILPESN